MEENPVTPENIREQEAVTPTPYIPEEPIKEVVPNSSKRTWLTPLNIIFAAAILGIYLLFFLKPAQKPREIKIPEAFYQKKGGITIAFVNSDTIKAHYQLFKDLQKKLEEKYSSLNNDISGRQNTLEKRAADLQKKYESKQISMEEAQKLDEQLKMEGKKLYDLNQQYTEQMSGEESRLNDVYVDSIYNFMARFNKLYKFDYILGYSKGGGILYAKDTLDITQSVIESLNEEYFQKYPEAKKAKK